MDADSLSLLIILRQELKEIASSLQPEIIEDVMTDNGLHLDVNDNHNDNDNGHHLDVNDNHNDNDNGHNNNNPGSDQHDSSPPPSLHEEDEKAQELQMQSESTPKQEMKSKQIGNRINDLIENYLTPTIKQLNKDQKKQQRKKRKKAAVNNGIFDSPSLMQSTLAMSTSFPSPPPSTSPSQSQQSHVRSLSEPQLVAAAHHNNPGGAADASSSISWREEVVDEMTNLSEKLGGCCRKFVTSLCCGCGVIQTGLMITIFLCFVLVFVFYRASELTLMLQEVNRWKELTVRRVEYELASEQKLAEIQFDLDVDIDKLKAEHEHREKMEILEAKKLLTKEFMDRNTRTVTTTYWNFLTTETETVSQTIFSEDDLVIFQNNILYYGFNPDKALQAPPQQPQQQQIGEAAMCGTDSNTCESPGISSDIDSPAQKDSFDTI